MQIPLKNALFQSYSPLTANLKKIKLGKNLIQSFFLIKKITLFIFIPSHVLCNLQFNIAKDTHTSSLSTIPLVKKVKVLSVSNILILTFFKKQIYRKIISMVFHVNTKVLTNGYLISFGPQSISNDIEHSGCKNSSKTSNIPGL